jgi:hypothetical protein
MQSVYWLMDRFVHIALRHCLSRKLTAARPSILVRFEARSPKLDEAIQFAGRQRRSVLIRDDSGPAKG